MKKVDNHLLDVESSKMRLTYRGTFVGTGVEFRLNRYPSDLILLRNVRVFLPSKLKWYYFSSETCMYYCWRLKNAGKLNPGDVIQFRATDTGWRNLVDGLSRPNEVKLISRADEQRSKRFKIFIGRDMKYHAHYYRERYAYDESLVDVYNKSVQCKQKGPATDQSKAEPFNNRKSK